MHTTNNDNADAETLARLLAEDLSLIGDVSYRPRLNGFALMEDGVMFGIVEPDGTAYLRASLQSARRFHALGGVKHPEMPYWSIPRSLSSDKATLLEVAYEAADVAHIALSFDTDDDVIRPSPTKPNGAFGAVATAFALLAA